MDFSVLFKDILSQKGFKKNEIFWSDLNHVTYKNYVLVVSCVVLLEDCQVAC